MADIALPLPAKVLRVSELTRYLKYVLEQDELLAALSVHGEISDLTKSPSGHVYFTLKDETSQITCVLFRREALRQAETVRELRKGVSVIVHGFLTVYEPRGVYQVYAERVVVQGEGALFARFQKLRDRLEQEGLFADERKRPLPAFPRSLALITSPGSQAYHDVLHRLRTQYPFVTVIEAGVSVQGDGAADEMALALDIVNRLTRADVILLVRGGGSPEELAAFNEERLARAIFASRIPVVTGIGHETDTSIADLVADRRAATPSLAAAVAVPDVGVVAQRTGQLHAQLSHALGSRLHAERRRWVELNRQLIRSSPQHRLDQQRRQAGRLSGELHRGVEVHLRKERSRLTALRAQLQALDPLAILSRGYAVLTDVDTGRVIGRTDDATPGQMLQARVSDGAFRVQVHEP